MWKSVEMMKISIYDVHVCIVCITLHDLVLMNHPGSYHGNFQGPGNPTPGNKNKALIAGLNKGMILFFLFSPFVMPCLILGGWHWGGWTLVWRNRGLKCEEEEPRWSQWKHKQTGSTQRQSLGQPRSCQFFCRWRDEVLHLIVFVFELALD